MTFGLLQWMPDRLTNPWVFVAGFFVLGIAHSGVRLGRKTHVVDMAEGNQRTDYVATANTVLGVLLLASGALSPLVPRIGPSGMLLLLAVCGFGGVLVGLGLPEVQHGADAARRSS